MRLTLLHSIILISSFLPEAYGSSYYIHAETGHDNNPGSEKNPWKSFDNVNHKRIQPGDTIYLHRGTVWEDTLDINNLEGGKHKISFLAYPKESALGNPVISCADDITSDLWPGIITNGGFESTPAGPCKDNLAGWNIKNAPKNSCTVRSEPRQGHFLEIVNHGPTTIVKSNKFTLSEKSSYRLTGKIVLEGRANVKLHLRAYQASSLLQLKQIDNDYRWASHTPPRNTPFLNLNTAGRHDLNVTFTGTSGNPAQLVFNIAGKARVQIDDVKMVSTLRNEWTAALKDKTVNPDILILNGTRIAKSGAESDESFYWYTDKGPRVHIGSKSPSPAQNILIGQRRTGIHLNNSSNIALKDITIQGCEGHSGRSAHQGAGILITNGSSNNTIQNITIRNSDEGIRIEGTPNARVFHKKNTINDVTIHNNRSKGISIRSFAIDTSIRNCNINNLATLPGDTAGQDILGISIGGSTGEIYNTNISNCAISNIAPEGNGPISGISAFNTLNTTMHNNTIFHSGKNGIILANSSDSTIDHNTINSTGLSPHSAVGSGIAVIADSSHVSNITILNNTVVNCNNKDRFYGGITLQAKPCKTISCGGENNADFYRLRGATVKNNIVYNCSGAYPFSFYAENIDFNSLYSDYNLYYPSRKDDILILYKGREYAAGGRGKYSEWRSLKSHNRDRRNIERSLEQNSLFIEPEFINPGSMNFQLHNNSPARNAGTRVNGAPTNMGAH